MALSSKIRVEVNATQTPTVDLGTAARSGTVSKLVTLASGVAAGQADLAWFDSGTLTASATVDLDLAGGLTDSFGNTLTFVKVKAIVVSAAAGNTNNVIVGGAAATQFVGPFGAAAHTVAVRPGGVFVISVGSGDLNAYGVTATTGDLLRLANSAGSTSVSYEIAIIGTSA